MRRWAVAGTLAVTGAVAFAPSAPGAGTGRDAIGSWTPPPLVNGNYVVTNTANETGFDGTLTDSADIVCHDAPHQGDLFWAAPEQDGSFGGAPTYVGSTVIFDQQSDGTCQTTSVRAAFWSPADNRLRVCPNDAAHRTAPPTLDTTSEVDKSDNCTDFRRTADPPPDTPKKHSFKDYIGPISRDANRCPKNGPRDYRFRIRYVKDDPANRLDVFVKRHGGFHKYKTDDGLEVNHLNVPGPGQGSRFNALPWTKKGGSTWRVRVKTQHGKTYTRQKHFKACHG
jgi:hypothetical protein